MQRPSLSFHSVVNVLGCLWIAGTFSGCGDGIDTGRAELTVTDNLVQWYRANEFTNQGNNTPVSSWPGVKNIGSTLNPISGTIYHYLSQIGTNSAMFSYLTFSGAPYFQGSSGLGNGQGDFSFYVVLSSSSSGQIIGMNESFGGTFPSTCTTNTTGFVFLSRVSSLYTACIGNVASSYQASVSTSAGSTPTQIHELHWSSNDTLQYRVAGSSQSTTSTPSFANLPLSGEMVIGSLGAGAAPYQLYEVILYSKRLEESDATKVRRYLSSRYSVDQD